MKLEDLLELTGALSDPVRLRLLALLDRHGTICVCEMVEIMSLPQYTVSRHLGVLRRAGWVEALRNGSRMDYRLHPELPPAGLQLLAGALTLATEDALVQADAEAARGLERGGRRAAA